MADTRVPICSRLARPTRPHSMVKELRGSTPPRVSPPGQARLRQVQITLNTPKSGVVYDVLIAQVDNRSSFCIQGFLLKSLKLRTCNLAAAIVRAIGTKLQLLESIIIFGPQTIHRVRREIAFLRELLD